MKTIVSGRHRFAYVSRDDWGAGPLRRGSVVPEAQFVGVASHHTVMAPGSAGLGDLSEVVAYMRRLQTVRPDLGNEVPYSAVIFAGATPDEATIAEGRGKGVTGAHTAGHNSTLYGFAWAANTNDEPVTPGMVAAFRWLAADWLTNPAGARKTIGHYEVYATECPGTSGKAVLGQLQPPFSRSATTPVDGPDPVMSIGSSGEAVREWQELLIALGHPLPKFGADSDFGQETETATKAFEARMKLVQDGVVSVEQFRLARKLLTVPVAAPPVQPRVEDDDVRAAVVALVEVTRTAHGRAQALLDLVDE